MKNSLFLLLLCCVSLTHAQQLEIDTLMQDKISIRAIAIDGDQLWYAGDKGRFGKIDTTTRTREKKQVFMDTLKIEFRSIAQSPTDVFVLSIGNPALLYKISKATMEAQPVYLEKHPSVFFDSMQFSDAFHGYAVGDPTESCFAWLTTVDGGNTWKRHDCSALPKLEKGEAAFAASNSNLIVKSQTVWLVSGGARSRVFRSDDGGAHFSVFGTPIVQGDASSGIYTADFYDDKIGFIAGGSYERTDGNTKNKAVTNDGGKTWKTVADGTGFGYASCVQYVPGSGGRELLAVGATGIHYSQDGGTSWRLLSDQRDLYTLRFQDATTAIAAGRNIILKLKLKK